MALRITSLSSAIRTLDIPLLAHGARDATIRLTL